MSPSRPVTASELCLLAGPWTASLGAVLERGVVLPFDYGLPQAQYCLTSGSPHRHAHLSFQAPGAF